MYKVVDPKNALEGCSGQSYVGVDCGVVVEVRYSTDAK